MMRYLLLAIPLLSASTPLRAERALFSCSFGTKQVALREEAGMLTYSYGPGGRPEMTLRVPRASVRHHYELFPHAAHRDIAVANGDYRYVLVSRFATPDYRGRGGEEVQGLIVMQKDRVLSTRACRSGDGFSADYDFAALPQEDQDLTYPLEAH